MDDLPDFIGPFTPDNDIISDIERAKYAIWNQCAASWATVGHIHDAWVAEYLDDASDDKFYSIVSDVCDWLGWRRWASEGCAFNITDSHRNTFGYDLGSASSKIRIAAHLRFELITRFNVEIRTQPDMGRVIPLRGTYLMHGLRSHGPVDSPAAEAEAVIRCAFDVLSCKPNAPDHRTASAPPVIYEDNLPEMTDEEYNTWFADSRIVDGVRMGPAFPPKANHQPEP